MSDRRGAGIAGSIGVLVIGVVAVLGGTLLGGGSASGGIGSWPPIVRAALTGLSVAIGLALLARALTMLATARPEGSTTPDGRGVRSMIRAVRLAFLAVAAFAAAGAWLVGSELLLIVALVIAGIDVIETTFLLIVARTHHGDEQSES